ncbi:cysteine desulfurase family protein [Acanthopleuribacter pedis]|uniref:cysteine desulfurase n=1 Tax=Acanthopleuribacter pedis TaxID=442870 RepID=A0A8J7U600_9BACT|nr:cysteine desulfurase family protein [Acanthopleuribacter pedis]MBO1323088.1 cysteine desulfurase [Acanthopleuribacter pedis]
MNNPTFPETIYLDYQATTPVDPRVLEAIRPYQEQGFANPASNHAAGHAVRAAVEAARDAVAASFNADPLGLVFTSGATEANNLALKGLAEQYGSEKRHLISSRAEHSAVMDVLEHLGEQGFDMTIIPHDSEGRLRMDRLAEAFRPDTLAVSLMAANNEVGTIHDIAAIGRLAKKHGAFFHCDAAQLAGKAAIDVQEAGIDLLTWSAHKFYGPPGCGGLWVRRKQPRVRLATQIHGGGHQRGFRSGTLNVPGIIGTAAALALCEAEHAQDHQHAARLGRLLQQELAEVEGGYLINGTREPRLANNLNLRFPGIAADRLLKRIPELAVSQGAACSSHLPGPSRVLLAMGQTPAQAREALRFSWGRFTTADEITRAAALLSEAVAWCRNQPQEAEEAGCSL